MEHDSFMGIYIYIYGYGSIPINTIFSGLFTSINPSYFDVNKKGDSMGFDTLPNSKEWRFDGIVGIATWGS